MYLGCVQCMIKNTYENVWKKLLCTLRAFLSHHVLTTSTISSQNTKYVQKNNYLMKKVLDQALPHRILKHPPKLSDWLHI